MTLDDRGDEKIASPESQRSSSPEGNPTDPRDVQTQTHSPSPVSVLLPSALRRPRKLSWGELLQRVFVVDAFACPRCGSRMRLLASIESEESIHAILGCLDVPARAPPVAPARPESVTDALDLGDLPIIER